MVLMECGCHCRASFTAHVRLQLFSHLGSITAAARMPRLCSRRGHATSLSARTGHLRQREQERRRHLGQPRTGQRRRHFFKERGTTRKRKMRRRPRAGGRPPGTGNDGPKKATTRRTLPQEEWDKMTRTQRKSWMKRRGRLRCAPV